MNFTFNSAAMAQTLPPVYDFLHPDQLVHEEQEYWPRVDVTVTAGEGIIKGKQATLRALEGVAQMKVTAENWKIIAAELDILDIPNKKEIIDAWRARFEAPPPPGTAGGRMVSAPTVPTADIPAAEGFEQLPTLPGTEGVI